MLKTMVLMTTLSHRNARLLLRPPRRHRCDRRSASTVGAQGLPGIATVSSARVRVLHDCRTKRSNNLGPRPPGEVATLRIQLAIRNKNLNLNFETFA